MAKKNKEENNKSNKIIGYVIVLIVLIGLAIYFVYSSHNKANTENKTLKKTVTALQKDNNNKEELINRLDAKNVNKEEEQIRNKAKDFVNVLYVSDPKMNDKKHFEKAKEVMDKSLAEQYYGDKRKSPIKYKTEIQDVKIYSERYSPKKSDYHMYVTLSQVIKGADDKITTKRKVASEITLKQHGNNDWKVSKFNQFDSEKIEQDNSEDE